VTKTTIAVVTEETSNLAGFMVMINNKLLLFTTNCTGFLTGQQPLQFVIRNGIPVVSATNFTPVRAATLPAPAIQSIFLLVVKREELRSSGFPLAAPCAGQQFQALRLLFTRLLGSFAVLEDVSFFFNPFIRAQNESRREPPSGCGRLSPGFPGFARL
jgi:hypothetical protein